MVSFKRMKDDLDDLGTTVSNKLPVIGRTGGLVLALVAVIVVLLIGIGIGYGSKSSGRADPSIKASESSPLTTYTVAHSQLKVTPSPNYIFLSNNSLSCPELSAERLLTTMKAGSSFEGLVVSLSCRGDYSVFPNQVKCVRKSSFTGEESLEWSHIPVCYPSVLVSKAHWSKTLHARSVVCKGDRHETRCSLTCIRDYIAVESDPYKCTKQPCKEWTLGDARCFMCDRKCNEMHVVSNPRASALLSSLGCDASCEKILVLSNGPAAVWQNKRTGLFSFIGEHNGRPVYQNNATKEFLFFTFTGSEWLVGPDFRKPHAGIQVYGNDDTLCPERIGGANVSRLYIDSSEPSAGGSGKWTQDDTLEFKCLDPSYRPVTCKCQNYKVYHLTYQNGTVPEQVEYLTGNFTRINEKDYGLMAPLYYDADKRLYLFSHHPQGRIWKVSSKLTTTPLRGVFDKEGSCPDDNPVDGWEWFKETTPEGMQVYVKDQNIHVKCLDGRFG